MAIPAVGSEAPDFSLPSTSGHTVSLSSLRGHKVLIAFFPKAFTRVCTVELCAFSEDHEQFEIAEVLVLPVSVDSVDTLRDFKSREKMSVDLLSDAQGTVARAYGAFMGKHGVSTRAYFLIDRDGIVRWAHLEDTPGNRRENVEILAQVGAIA